MKSFSNILWGIVLVVLGVIWGLNTLNITNINLFFNGWWTLFIIVPSFIGLFNEQEKTGDVIGLVIGILLLLGSNDIVDFAMVWKLMFPIILIILGLSFIFKNSILNKTNEKIKQLNKNKSEDNVYYATFSAQKLNFDNDKFKSCDLQATFGGISCNLVNADIQEDAIINVNAVFGGVDIILPKGVRVECKSNSIFGGIDNKVKTTGKEEKTIYINATCLFGGVDIK